VAALPGAGLTPVELATHSRPHHHAGRPEYVEPDHARAVDPQDLDGTDVVVVTATPTTNPSLSPVVGALGASGIPEIALRAYRAAEQTMSINKPGCGLRWSLVAAIGRVESNHGRFGGNQLREDGSSTKPIRGIALDGRPGVATIRDTDGGALDGDPVYDRATGPMQFIPSSWSFAGADGNGDGRKDPDNIFDAALATGNYLCAGDTNLRNPAERAQAVFRYNHSNEYVALVLGLADEYERGVTALPQEPAAPEPPPPLSSPELPPASITPPPFGQDPSPPPATTTLPPSTAPSSSSTTSSSTTSSTSTSSTTSTTAPCPPTTTTSTVVDPSSTTTTSTTTTTVVDPSSTTTTTVFDPCAPTTTTAAAPMATSSASAAAPGVAVVAAASGLGSWVARRKARRSPRRTWPGSSVA
jgi:hypothetical protein